MSCSLSLIPHPNYKQLIDKLAKLWFKAIWCNLDDCVIRVNHCQFILVPEEVSFYEPETFSCAEQMDPDNFICNGSTEFYANMPHNPAEKCVPVMVTTQCY